MTASRGAVIALGAWSALAALACGKSESAKADAARASAAAVRGAADSAKTADQCPPPAAALAGTLAAFTPVTAEAAFPPADRSLPRAWGPIALGMPVKEFASLTGVTPVPCTGAECELRPLMPALSIARVIVEASAAGTSYAVRSADVTVPKCSVRLDAGFFRDTLITIVERRDPLARRDSLWPRYLALFGPPARSDSTDTGIIDAWVRGPTTMLIERVHGSASGPAIVAITLDDPSAQSAAIQEDIAAAVRRGDSIVRADSAPPSRTWPLPRGWASLRLGMTEAQFSLATGVDPADCGAEAACPDGGTAAKVLVDSTPGMIVYRAPSHMENSTANRDLVARFHGRRLYLLLLTTRYAAAAAGTHSMFDSLRRQAAATLGDPSRVRKTDGGAPQYEWRRGPGLYWLRRASADAEEAIDIGYLDCRLAPRGTPDCRDLPPEGAGR